MCELLNMHLFLKSKINYEEDLHDVTITEALEDDYMAMDIGSIKFELQNLCYDYQHHFKFPYLCAFAIVATSPNSNPTAIKKHLIKHMKLNEETIPMLEMLAKYVKEYPLLGQLDLTPADFEIFMGGMEEFFADSPASYKTFWKKSLEEVSEVITDEASSFRIALREY